MDSNDTLNKTFASEVPKKLHDHPLITKAKMEEIRRCKDYDTVEQVTETEEMQVIYSRWVVTEKNLMFIKQDL